MGFGRAEAKFDFGGDLAIGPTGDWVVLTDTAIAAPATTQRVLQLINTCALDLAGGPLGNMVTLAPDDPFNPTYGSSIPRLLGASVTQSLLNEIQARLLNAFAQDPGIATSPAPVLDVQSIGGHIVVNSITVYDVTGQPILIPSDALSVFGVLS